MISFEDFQKLDSEQKLEEIYKSVEKTRRYFKATLIITLVVIVLPLLLMPLVISRFLSIYNLGSLGL
jgi:hypothetical protein